VDLQLSPRQQSTAAAAVTILSAVVIVTAVGALLWLVSAFILRFSNVFFPLAVAAVAALVFNPFYEWLHRRLHLPATAALAVVFLSLLLPVAGFLWFFGALLVDQVSDLASKLPQWWQHVAAEVQARWPKFVQFLQEDPWGQRLKALFVGGDSQGSMLHGLQQVGGGAMWIGALAVHAAATVFSWAVLPIYFAFFLLVGGAPFQDIERLLPFLKAETRRDVLYLMHEFLNILVAFFRGQLLIAFIEGVLFAIGFSSIGLNYGFILGLIVGFLNVIPYLGTILGLAATLPIAFFQEGGGLQTAVLVLVVFVVVHAVEGYVLTPKIMGGRTGLHPIVIIVAVFFWGNALGGIGGMILAIPLTAFLVVFWRLAREKYIRELV
jgi:predicted PurR-regulated permease PerM